MLHAYVAIRDFKPEDQRSVPLNEFLEGKDHNQDGRRGATAGGDVEGVCTPTVKQAARTGVKKE